jgi:hypothetical protein
MGTFKYFLVLAYQRIGMGPVNSQYKGKARFFGRLPSYMDKDYDDKNDGAGKKKDKSEADVELRFRCDSSTFFLFPTLFPEPACSRFTSITSLHMKLV